MDGLDFDGEVLREALGDDASPPKVIFTIVIDGGGWNALQEHPSAWPNIARIEDAGTSYLNATIGSAPSITGALHATFGTGVYPTTHGIPGNQMRGADGENTDAWLQNADPRYLEAPTVSELWDEANGNRPVVGTVSYEGWHLGMIGHGAARPGADKDVAVLWEAEENEWWINEEFYELPDYLEETDLERLERYEEELDERDGVADGLWFGHDLEEIREDVVRPGSPAFVRFTGDAVVDVMRNEGLGADSVTDVFWVEMKMPDFAGHRWNMLGPEEADVIRATDAQIGRFVAELDRMVGRGDYVVAISADHGQQPLPDLYGGWRINSNELEADVERRFGPIVEKVTTVDMFLDMDAVEDRGVDLEEVAEYLGGYTIGDNVPSGQPGADLVPQGRLDDRVFAGAFPTDYLQALDEESIETFGDSDYPSGDLTIEPPGAGGEG
ncbi:MAG TPA: alkaline phosphatase family protein [Actinomycetota bacterium]|nr:alkaline phosphatase family protein [Actinomycetota bacterium]